MALILLSWFWFGISICCTGYATVCLLNKLTGYSKKDPDTVLMMGLCFLTVYAQFFSLIYKVGAFASAILLLINFLILLFMRKGILQYILEVGKYIHSHKCLSILLLALFFVLLKISSGTINHYDTALYHGQSIRWIEEYGIVPGLGNLHNRFAYNSSIFCLQALFSLKFLVNQSVHSVNGFITLIMLSYALASMKGVKKQKFFVSDFLRFGLFIFFNDSQNYLLTSSAGSDHLALGLVIYIFVKWLSLEEDGEKNQAPYAYLCLLGVFAISVKLSAAMVILLTLLPAIRLINNKKWKQISIYISFGVIIILPFIIRNVIISGYLLYPYPELDFFNVDWKMPSYTLTYDRNEIKTWGWGLNDVNLFYTPFQDWFPYWYENLSYSMKLLFILNIISALLALWFGISKILHKKWDYLWIALSISACFLLWFCGAPLPRYGSAYMTLLPLYVIGNIISDVQAKHPLTLPASILIIVLGSCCMYPLLHYGITYECTYLKRCADYAEYACSEYHLDNEVIYVPTNGDQAGYYAFPSTPYSSRINLIELRRGNLSEGFRMKEEYRQAFVDTYGQVHATNMFKK